MLAMTYAALSFVIVVGVTFFTGALLLRWWPAVARQRFGGPGPEVSQEESILRWDERAAGGWRLLLERLGRPFGGRNSARASRYRRRLAWAGFHDPRAVWFFIGLKVGCAILAGLAYPVYGLLVQQVLPYLLVVSYGLVIVGFFVPDYWLGKRIRSRQRQIVNALPDVLDLLMVCVESGMGFDAAVARVAEQPEMRRSALHQEMLRMHLEMRAGRPRDEALRALGERTGVEEVQALVGAFIQTDRMGTPLGKTLRIYSESARVQRRHRAEKLAYLAPLKMIFPTVIFLMPSFFLITMGPSLIKLLEVVRTLGR
jgi:tight adherence protein C